MLRVYAFYSRSCRLLTILRTMMTIMRQLFSTLYRMLLLMLALLTMLLRPLLSCLFQCLFVVPPQVVRFDEEYAYEECYTCARGHKVVDISDALRYPAKISQ